MSLSLHFGWGLYHLWSIGSLRPWRVGEAESFKPFLLIKWSWEDSHSFPYQMTENGCSFPPKQDLFLLFPEGVVVAIWDPIDGKGMWAGWVHWGAVLEGEFRTELRTQEALLLVTSSYPSRSSATYITDNSVRIRVVVLALILAYAQGFICPSFPSSSLYASFLSASLPPSLLLFPSFLPCFLLFSLLYSLPLSLPTFHFVILQKPFLTPAVCQAHC